MTNNTPDYNNNLYFEEKKIGDLTELWKKGELPSGWYYVKLIRGEYRIDLYINGKNEWIDCPDNIIDTVVCEVPSYDAYMALIRAIDNVTDDNAELKELLKECKDVMNMAGYVFAKVDDVEKAKELIKKIDEAIK